MPSAIKSFILPRISGHTDQDVLHDMIMCCYESIDAKGRFSKNIASAKLKEMAQKKKLEQSILYNPYRNISLNECVGENQVAVSEWLNLSDWREWD